jgi:hypothetical protein
LLEIVLVLLLELDQRATTEELREGEDVDERSMGLGRSGRIEDE